MCTAAGPMGEEEDSIEAEGTLRRCTCDRIELHSDVTIAVVQE